MAGDLDFSEHVVLAGEQRVEEFAAPLPVIHEYGRLRIVLGDAPVAAPIPEEMLSDNERLGYQAFKLRLSADYQSAKADRLHANAGWGGDQVVQSLEAPLVVDQPPKESAAIGELPSEAPGYRLRGRIAVAVIIASGSGALRISDKEQVKISAEVQNGLSFLAGNSPARDVTFVTETHLVEVTAANVPSPVNYEQGEMAWRDECLQKLGYQTGTSGIKKLVTKLISSKSASYAYCVFFTKYNVYHFAYAYTGSAPYIIMNMGNDGWGVDNIDRVFAHETCHIFGAPDEYAASGCSCGGSWGIYGVANFNCEACAEDGGVPCLMKANTWEMCAATPYHVGYSGLPAWGHPLA